MEKLFRRRGFLTALWAAVLGWPAAPACSVPVFRYALERWQAEVYEVVVFQRGPLAPGEREVWNLLDREGPAQANCRTALVDLSNPLDAQYKEMWAAQSSPTLPWMVLRPTAEGAAGVTIWAGPLTAETVRSLLDSPARREISRRISSGHSCVWLLLECGDRAADDAAAALIESRLRKLEKELKLPDLEGDGSLEEGGSGGAAPPRPGIPLRIQFSLLRLARSDPAEPMLLAYLLKLKEPATPARPIAFPVFGRGRVLGAYEGKEIGEEAIDEVSSFLVGPCSCELKGMNPGADLLIAADWDRALEGGQVAAPELVGISGFLEKAGPAQPPAGPPREFPGGPFRSLLSRSLLTVAAVAAAFLLIGTAVFFRRARRSKA